MIFYNIIKSMRPEQWTKNLLVFAGIIFSGNLTAVNHLITTFEAFVVFCLVSGCVYIINDIVDKCQDKHHPTKKNRPIACGILPVKAAAAWMIIVSIGVLLVLPRFNAWFISVLVSYIGLSLSYSLFLKKIVILDLIALAIGFVLRALAGVVAINVEISYWLIVCTFLLALLLIIGKRRHELIILKDQSSSHRDVLGCYSVPYLDQLVVVVSSATVVAYSLYTMSEQTIDRLGTTLMPITIPYVFYGIFRYLYLIHNKNMGGAPELLIIEDRALSACLFLWIATAILLIYCKQ